jgi:hypothetical protein
MKMKPLVVLGLSAAAGVVPGKPAAKPAEASNNAQTQQQAQQPVNTQAQSQEAINAATHERLFGGNPWVKNAQGGMDWVGPKVG